MALSIKSLFVMKTLQYYELQTLRMLGKKTYYLTKRTSSKVTKLVNSDRC